MTKDQYTPYSFLDHLTIFFTSPFSWVIFIMLVIWVVFKVKEKKHLHPLAYILQGGSIGAFGGLFTLNLTLAKIMNKLHSVGASHPASFPDAFLFLYFSLLFIVTFTILSIAIVVACKITRSDEVISA